MVVNLRIDRLVLHGFPNLPNRGIGAAVETHLARMLSEQGIPAGLSGGSHTPRLDGGAFEFDAGAAPEEIAAQIAEKIYGALR